MDCFVPFYIVTPVVVLFLLCWNSRFKNRHGITQYIKISKRLIFASVLILTRSELTKMENKQLLFAVLLFVSAVVAFESEGR